MKTKVLFTFICSIFLIVANAEISPTQLTCEYLKNPYVIDVPHPRLSWVNLAGNGERGQFQSAWQVRVATSKEMLSKPDLWDSQKVETNQSVRVEYQGKDLKSHQECWWQVRVWDKDNNVSEWSEPAMWKMGILNPDEWKAKWIGPPWQGEEALARPDNPNAVLTEVPPPAPLLRKKFLINKEVKEATAYVTGLGYFEFYMNGKKIGNDVLVPNQTNYGKRPHRKLLPPSLRGEFKEYKVMYLAYNIKENLKKGENVAGGILGNGFYNPAKYWAEAYGSPRFLSQLHITYTDGTEEIIVSDTTWKVAKSPIVMDMVYYGEIYDARKEQPGWCSPGFDDSPWEFSIERQAPEGKLVAHIANPDRITQRLSPLKIEKIEEGTFLIDFGIEISGWVRLNNVEAPAGHKVDIKFISSDYSGDNSYIFKGEGRESYAPRFNWFVFSRVEISNWYGELKPEQVIAEAVNIEIEETSVFKTSNQLFNDINKIWKRSQLDNMHGGIASDCPHRERSAYTGDGQVACVTVMHNFDARSFYHKWISDIRDAQIVENGYVPNGAPWQPGCGGGVAWGAAICIMPWEFYLHYGALDILEDNYEGMKSYIHYMQNWINENGIMHSMVSDEEGKPLLWFNLGEWVWPTKGVQIPDEMVHTFYFWRCASLTAKAAKALNRPDEAIKYQQLAERTKKAFHKRFYDEKEGTYGKGGGNILALKMGVPDDQYKKVVTALKTDIKENNGHLDTGIFGTQFFFEILSENGMHDLAYEAMNKRTAPSYGYWLEQGATTTWESWSGEHSRNHPMFGGGLVWFYRKLAGMNADPEQPGYRHIIFKPYLVNEVDSVIYSNVTPYGKAGIRWEKVSNKLVIDVTVPTGSNATVYVPCKDKTGLKESGVRIKDAIGVKILSIEKDMVILEIESGEYHFMVES